MKILHWLQSLLAKVLKLSVLNLNVSFPLHQVLICGTAVLLQLRQFWDIIWSKVAHKSLYTASIRGIKMRLPELQDDEKKAKKLRLTGLLEGWKDIKQVLHIQGLFYVLKANKQAPQRPSCRLFWHRKDLKADSQKVILADATKRCWSLRKRLRRMLGFKGSLLQAL